MGWETHLLLESLPAYVKSMVVMPGYKVIINGAPCSTLAAHAKKIAWIGRKAPIVQRLLGQVALP